tara:strand:+ start:871 stop:1656 length:786 start_codon:yes stop_codon:yes gene_type:complete
MRLDEKFKELKQKGKKAFIAYVPFGFPTISRTKDICLSLEAAGVDVIELGIPFSDPLADGPIIQKATTLALKNGANLDKCLRTLGELKESLKVPLVIMSYYNPIFRFGINKFFKAMVKLDISAITIVDLPLQESKDYIKIARAKNIDTIFFATPTTSTDKLKKITRESRGFIYYISVTGITGPKDFKYQALIKDVKKIKSLTKRAVCVGFGIHNRSQVKRIQGFSDGVIVGSSIVKFIEDNYKKKNFLKQLNTYAKSLCLK